MKQKRDVGTILYLTAFVLWLFVGLVKYTYFKDMLPMKEISKNFLCTALCLLLVKTIMDFRISLRNVLGLFLLVLFMTIACAGGRLQFAVMFALIYCATNVSLDKILKTALTAQLLLFLSTIVAARSGVLEDFIWDAATRQRHGLGFTHCMLASNFGLYISLIYIGIVKKMTLFRAAAILLLNGILYHFTDGRTDMYLSVLFVISAFILGNIGQKIKGQKVFGCIFAALPMILWTISVVATAQFSLDNPIMVKVNTILNHRLSLGYDALAEYGFPLFGYKIKWVGQSNLYYNPTLKYNYVDSSYLMMMFTYGSIFVLCYCVAMGWLLYKKMAEKDTMAVVILLIILAFGVINPQSMYLTYNPFLVLLAGFWNPGDSGKNPEEEVRKETGKA